ncbi:TPA: hypothetical protein ACOJPK_003376 [Pseudomonas putida]|uniref:hypothetical protein n=1 Tax=Pseudomonas sp. TaxID=306 RepID=UPI002648D631|nr:hypothetical protein [Pseudomonas sp.]MDN5520210.1 hypothetical protein [Pseudomonas sp.]MDN5532005.1 hypothetical protein [Pseudomonas sp.]
MKIDRDPERASRDAEAVMVLTVFASAAITEPDFNKANFLAKIEDNLSKIEKSKKPFAPDLLKAARIVVEAVKDHGALNGKN